MNGGVPFDGRREKALRAEMLRRAAAMLGGDGQERPAGEIASAIIGVAARIEEEVTRRLDRVPDKQTDNFFSAMGIGRDPARPAQVPVAFTLADPAPDALVAPASTQLMASGETGSVVFETSRAIVLAPGSIAALVGVDAAEDRIFRPPGGVVGAELPREPAAERTLRSGAGAGENKLQISLATDLAPGTILRIGPGAEATEHDIVAIESDLVTVDPPLDRTLEPGTPVAVVTDFAPFAGHRDRQSHTLYLGHETLLNVPSPLNITVTGVSLPPATEWSWWGKTGEDPPDWHKLVPVPNGGRLTLKKEAGQPIKSAIRGRETLWLRARLPGRSDQALEARDIKLSVAGDGICSRAHTERCSSAGSPMAVGFEAIANTTPVVLNGAFHPFGREPRLFDSFYIGCAEAFSKPGAEVSLCFKFAGPELGPLAMVAGAGLVQVFGVGEDGLLYRAQFGKDQPRLLPIALRRDQTGGSSLPARAPVAARLVGERVLVAIAGQGTVYFADLPFENPIDAAAIEWKTLASDEDRSVRIGQIVIVVEEDGPVVLAQSGSRVLSWRKPAEIPPAKAQSGRLVPLQGTDAALVIGPVAEGGSDVIAVRGPGQSKSPKLTGDPLPAFDLAAWAMSPAAMARAAVAAAEADLPGLTAAVNAAGSELQLAIDAFQQSAADPTRPKPRPEAVPEARAKLEETAEVRRQAVTELASLKAKAEKAEDARPSPWTIFLAGYETDRGNAPLRVVRVATSDGAVEEFARLSEEELPGQAQVTPQRLPIAFQPPPPSAASSPKPNSVSIAPTIVLASATPARFVWRGRSYKKAAATPIGASDNPHRQFVSAPGWIAVHRSHLGLLYRPAGRNGDWADEFVLATEPGKFELAEGVSDREVLYAAPDTSPKGNGFEILRSATAAERVLLRPSPGLQNRSTASFFVHGDQIGGVLIEEERVRLVDDALFAQWKVADAERSRLEGVVSQARAQLKTRTTEQEAATRKASEAEGLFRSEQLKFDETKKQADAARSKASGANQRLKRATEATEQAEATLVELRAEAVTAAAALKQATDARKDADKELIRLEAEAKAEADAAAGARRRLSEATAARQKVETDLPGLVAAVAAAESVLRQATDASKADAEEKVRLAKVAQQDAEARLTILKAEEKAAEEDSKKAPTVTPAMVAAAAKLVETTKASEVSLKAAKDDNAERIKAAETQEAAAKKEEGEARPAAAAAEREKGLREEAEAAAMTGLETARSARNDLVRAAEGLAGQVNEAKGALDAREKERDAAIGAAERLKDYSVRVDGPQVDIVLFGDGQDPDPRQIWHLKRSAADPQWWDRPASFPPADFPPEGTELRYRILRWERDIMVQEAVSIRNPGRLEARVQELGATKPLRFDKQPGLNIPPVEHFTRRHAVGVAGMAVQPELFEDGTALLTAATEDWRSLGPVQPPNPALSWEYWNGGSWWALDGAGLIDSTSNLLVDGGLFFVVPVDLEATEVEGRKNHWIRARLVGGDYGEAQVTVKSTEGQKGETRQTVERDMTTIRAPYVTSLQLGFCARTEVAPEIVLTEDSLGALDQTSANAAGLPVALFTPLADVMNGNAPAAPGLRRALMIGFEKPVRGDPVSLYVDASPGGVPGELVAEILRDGRFQAVGISDETRALSEPGMIQLSLNAPPDQTDLLGTIAHWVRLRPSDEAPAWSPRISSIHLNAVRAFSVETRKMESLGHSSGIPNQSFLLAEAPVAPESLELRLHEALGEEDLSTSGLDILRELGPKPGPWVRWAEVDDLGEAGVAARGFLLDAETGEIRFGDGLQGAIPPLGAELLAVRYRHVAGSAGNAVAVGAGLQLMAPLSGIDRVIALDAAAGGSDVETAEGARRRGTAKMRHGDRILTLADLEDYVQARSPTIAQVRAANKGGAVRLVVAATGPEPRPVPAVLRELARAVRATAGYGIARADGLSVVPPRLLPLRIELALQPDDPDRFIEMADAAERALIALFDPATGGFDRQGWPIGRLPAASDVAAALEDVSRLGVVCDITVLRADRRPAEPLPEAMPADVLVRLDPNDIVAERRREAAA